MFYLFCISDTHYMYVCMCAHVCSAHCKKPELKNHLKLLIPLSRSLLPKQNITK